MNGDWFPLIFMLGMVSGVFVIVMAMRQRSHLLEMQHREKMAMIERGQVPGPDLLGRTSVLGDRGRVFHDRPNVFASRSQTIGVILIGVGLGFMSIVGIASGNAEVGIGIGGAVCILGAAFIVNSVLSRSGTPHVTYGSALPPEPPKFPPDPPL